MERSVEPVGRGSISLLCCTCERRRREEQEEEKQESFATMEENQETAAVQDSWDKLRLPDKFAKLLDSREPRTATLREAGGGRRQWDVQVVFDGEGHMYLERGWEPFARAHGLGMGNVLVFSYDGDAVLTVKVFDLTLCRGNYQHDNANTGSNNSIDSSNNSSSSAEIDDAPTSQFTVTLKKCHLSVRARQQEYLNVPPEFRNAHGYEDRTKVLLTGTKKNI